MELALAIAATVGPLAVLLALLWRSLRRRRQPRAVSPPWQGPMGGRGGRAGDRSPNRPRVPTLSGGAALDIPMDESERIAG